MKLSSKLHHDTDAHAPKLQDKGTIFRRETAWGYSLSQQDGLCAMRPRAELGLRVLSFLAFLVMAALWLWPGASFAFGLLGIKLGLTVFLGVMGLTLGYMAERGLRREVQVDLQRNQLRVVWLNRRDETRLHTVIGFDEIGSVFVRRGPVPGRTTHLDVRFGTQGEVETLFEGREEVLRELWYDLNSDLRDEASVSEVPVMAAKAIEGRRRSLSRKAAIKALPRALR
ncbi:hypothetical protein [Celeribacter naphthalenivorans]|uniref:hypothetical protein n=1 Tax=Celeribacter naphthalenivorans TaxID=1614694 RepID=UPI001CFC2B33|nr:hypothetical protein [Celeribacter naphthalenivorans]